MMSLYLFSVLQILAVLQLPLFARGHLYYVSPTSDITLCPNNTRELCFPLSYYINDGYLTSNNVFKFLPGEHVIERPLTVYQLHNVTLESAQEDTRPTIKAVFDIPCYQNNLAFAGGDFLAVPRCSLLYFDRCSNITLRGLQVESTIHWHTPVEWFLWLVAGDISFSGCKNVLVENVHAKRGLYLTTSEVVNVTKSQFGALKRRDSLCKQLYNATTAARIGVYLHNTHTTSLSNVTVIDAKYYGVYLQDTTDTVMKGLVSLDTLIGTALTLNLARNTIIQNPILEICSAEYIQSLYVTSSLDTRVEGWNMKSYSAVIIAENNTNLHFESLISAKVEESEGEKTTVVYIDTCTNVTFEKSDFNKTARADELFTDVVSLPSIFHVDFSLGVKFSNCMFAENQRTAIHARASDIILSGEVQFINNSAAAGAAMIISKESNLTLDEQGHTLFRGNRAVSSGGAIYIVTGEDVPEQQLRNRWCFLHVEGDRSQPRMTFRDNWAGKAGDVLYGGHLAIGFNGIHDNCLQNFWNASDITQQKSLSVVSSESSRVCLCDFESSQHDCLKIHSQPYAIYPGETLSLSVVIVGQAFGTVTGSVFAQLLQPSSDGLAPLIPNNQHTQVVGKESCNLLNYTIFKAPVNGSSNTILTLTPQFRETSHYISNDSHIIRTSLAKYEVWAKMDILKTPFPKNILEFPVYVNITLLPCPIGFELRGHPESKCECDPLLRGLEGIECDITRRTIARSGLVWIGIDESEENRSDSLLTSNYCPLNYCKKERTLLTMDEYDIQCNYDREGVLCGQCQQNLSLALGSSKCLPCSNRYLVLILPFLLAGVALVAIIKLGNMTIAHGTLTGLVFYVNIIKANEYIFLPGMELNPLTLFISWTNLDLGVETCFWDGLDAYGKAWLQFVFPLYLWAIAGGIVILSKYSSRVAGLMGSNSVSVLATLFFLSYTKLLRIVIVGLSYTVLETPSGPRIVWSSDGSLDYLGARHVILFTACIATLVFFWLPYTLLLFCGQWLYKIRCSLVVKLLGRLTPFLDAHYAPLKGHHRYWFGAQLLIRAAILIVSSTVPSDSFSTIVFSISLTAVILTALSSVGFYQNKLISMFEMTIFANLSLLSLSVFFTTSIGATATIPSYISISIVFLQFIALVVYHVDERFKLSKKTRFSFCKRLSTKKGFPKTVEENSDFFMVDSKRREEETEEGRTVTRGSICNLLEELDTGRTY